MHLGACFRGQMSFTINKHRLIPFRTTQGCDAMSSCNCTPDTGIINTDTVYDVSFVLWKCEVDICTHRGLACLYDIKALSIIILNVASFKMHRVAFMYSISPHSDNTTFEKCTQLARGMGEGSCCAPCSSPGRLSVKTPTEL